MTTKPTRRRGAVVIPALVCLVLATTLCGLLLRQSLTRRKAARDEERRMQAEWLVESGLARASARLAADKAYPGETWEVPPSALRGSAAGVVRIDVKPADGRPGARLVRAEADYPSGDDHRARQTKTLTIALERETTGGPK